MTVVSPFAALRYDAEKVGDLERVVTQPYDKITPEMQRQYLQQSPFNLAYLIQGESREGDTSTNSVYTRAAVLFRSWREQGILVRHSKPAFYAYFQQFSLPEALGGRTLLRKGFVGLGKLEAYDRGVIFRHEQTLSAPKADRLELLRATRAQFEQIFMLYSDPQRQVESLLEEVAAQPPVVRVQDEYGVVHLLWDVEMPSQIRAIQEGMQDKKLIIADGHHRYETALNFQSECQASRPHSGICDCNFVPMTFVNMDSEGIVILPTHRVVLGLPGFSSEGFLSSAAGYFQLTEYAFANPS